MELLEGVWIYEASELSGIRHTDVGKMKAFLSRTEDRGRPAYARYRESIPRQCIIIGTTNDTIYLKDRTGNRRFLPVETNIIDLKRIASDRDQLWAEAVYREANGEPITLPEELWEAAALVQKSRVFEDVWLELLETVCGYLHGEVWRISTQDLLRILDISANASKSYHSKRLAECMKELGWTGPKKLRVNGKLVRGYERKDSNTPKACKKPQIVMPSVPHETYEL